MLSYSQGYVREEVRVGEVRLGYVCLGLVRIDCTIANPGADCDCKFKTERGADSTLRPPKAAEKIKFRRQNCENRVF